MNKVCRKSLFIAISLLLLAPFVFAQEGASKVRMKAKLAKSGGRTENVESYYYSRIDKTHHRMGVSIELWNFGKEEEEVELVTYFFGSSVNGSGASGLRIADFKKEKVKLQGQERKELERVSRPLISRTYTDSYYYSNQRSRTGQSYKGWAVVISKEGKILHIEASNHPIKAAIQDPKKFEELGGNDLESIDRSFSSDGSSRDGYSGY